ncbi:DUF389 domain-containing protein [Dermatophilaceae bacterium Soc4.6]
MLVALRLSVPPDLMGRVEPLLRNDPAVCNIVVLPGAAHDPEGDAVLADVARERAGALLAALDDLGLGERGAISVSELSATPYAAARAAERAAPGNPEDGVIWRVVEEQGWEAVRPSVSFHAFLWLAVALAAVAVVTDSAVLVVGAMVVGPEFGLVAAICIGLVLRRPRIVGRSVVVLLTSFAAAVAAVTLLALLARWAGWVTPGLVTAPRPLTGFIWRPDHWSFVVALLAGVAGVLGTTTGKSSSLVGVFISVTTVPAAGNLALGIAVWSTPEMTGSVQQLGLNLSGLVVAGTATLLVQRVLWHRVTLPSHRAATRPGRVAGGPVRPGWPPTRP